MKMLLKRIWQGDINLVFAYLLAFVAVFFSVPISLFIFFMMKGSELKSYLGFSLDWSFAYLAPAFIFIIISLVILWRSASKSSSKFWSVLAHILTVFVVLIYGGIIFIAWTILNHEGSPEETYRSITEQEVPIGARVVYSNSQESAVQSLYSTLYSRPTTQIILDASGMDLIKWISEVEFRLNIEWWIDQDLAKSNSGIRENRRFFQLHKDADQNWSSYKPSVRERIKARIASKNRPASMGNYKVEPFLRLLKCDSRIAEEPEDKYFVQMCKAFKNKEAVWLARTRFGKICCRLDIFAFEKEKIIWAIGY